MKHFCIDIDVEYDGHYVPAVAGKLALVDGKSILLGRKPARVDGFKIWKFVSHEWRDITYIFEPKELEQRKAEYLVYLEEERDGQALADDAS